MTETAVMPDTEPEIDQELLAEAQQQLGAAHPNEAINEGLRIVVEEARARRRQALEEIRRMSREGLFDYGAIEEADR